MVNIIEKDELLKEIRDLSYKCSDNKLHYISAILTAVVLAGVLDQDKELIRFIDQYMNKIAKPTLKTLYD
jgi:hypothetical protein